MTDSAVDQAKQAAEQAAAGAARLQAEAEAAIARAPPAAATQKRRARTRALGEHGQAAAFPLELYAPGGAGGRVPIRATVHGFGPLLLSRALGLNDTQASSLELVFHYAEDAGLALLDL